jgi:hypothetical protein
MNNTAAGASPVDCRVRPDARCCKTCRFLGVNPDAKGRIVVRARNAYECLVVVPQPALPESMTRAYGYRWPLAKSYMTGDSGRECPTWEQRA